MVAVARRFGVAVATGICAAAVALTLLGSAVLTVAIGATLFARFIGKFGRRLIADQRAHVIDAECAARQAFDGLEVRAFGAVAKRVRDAAGTSAGGAADAVNVGFRFVGQFVVDDVSDTVNVDTAGGDVGRDEDAGVTVAEASSAR